MLTNIPALAAISIALWASAANELVNLIFGVWLEDSFGLKIAALAGASAVIGLSELGGRTGGIDHRPTRQTARIGAGADGQRACRTVTADRWAHRGRRADWIISVLHHL
ncbi:MAG: hypothetical protein MZU91_02035 [Desulfosudis oleivorans]|nr:hypothetical protein [Desulfosudis oleivorans]